MNWYLKTIFADSSGLENYLTNIGATPDIIQFIISKGKEVSQFLTDEFRKNRNLNLQQLQALQVPEKIDPYLKSEYLTSENYPPPMQKWILVSFRKLREGQPLEFINENPHIYNHYMNFLNELNGIADWFLATHPDIFSFSAEQAMEASDEWHKMMIGEGEGKIYEPTKKESIIYGPVWDEEEWQGWTMQEVTSKNDLLAEGNKMRHCVGGFCNKPNTTIYSLRDPQNNPHVTIETNGSGEYVRQAQGNSNQYPKEQYIFMVKEWVEKGKNAPAFYQTSEISVYDRHESEDRVDDYINIIDTFTGHGYDYDYEFGYDSQQVDLFEELGLESDSSVRDQDLADFNPSSVIHDIFDNLAYEKADIVYREDERNNYDNAIFARKFVKFIRENKPARHEQNVLDILYQAANSKEVQGVYGDETKRQPEKEENKFKWQQSFINTVLDEFEKPEDYKKPEDNQPYLPRFGSSWYLKTKFADGSGLENYLNSLGATPDIVQFIISKGKEVAQFLTDEFRRNRNLNLQQLQSLQVPQKDPYLQLEHNTASKYPQNMQKWILVNCRKLRGGLFPPDESKMMEFLVSIGQGVNNQQTPYLSFLGGLDEIGDWVERNNIDISSYSAQEATVASQEWHKMMAGQGEGKMYEPTNQENIIYGPQWKNEKWNGWTIQKITSENDILAEGNKMENCVGSYCDKMNSGKLIIYSLRDPQNNPHITMGTDEDGEVEQINGHSNKDPKPEYKAMIKEWVLNNNLNLNRDSDHWQDMKERIIREYQEDIEGEGPHEYDWDTGSDNVASYVTPSDIKETLQEMAGKDEYGFKIKLNYSDPRGISKDIINIVNRQGTWAKPELYGLSKLLINVISKIPDNEDKLSHLRSLENYFWGLIDAAWDSSEGWKDPPSLPAADEKWKMSFYNRYQKAIQEYNNNKEKYKISRHPDRLPLDFVALQREKQGWGFHGKNLVGGSFANEGLNYIYELKTNGII
jgi:hypothetical protein